MPAAKTIDSARAFFEALIAHGPEPHMHEAVGSCEFDVEGEGRWLVNVDHGNFALAEASSKTKAKAKAPTATVHVPRQAFLRMVRGEDHENLVTAAMRGALRFEGDIAF